MSGASSDGSSMLVASADGAKTWVPAAHEHQGTLTVPLLMSTSNTKDKSTATMRGSVEGMALG